jgi:hypothetical protein
MEKMEQLRVPLFTLSTQDVIRVTKLSRLLKLASYSAQIGQIRNVGATLQMEDLKGA